ncbi:MAG: hypothetical protein U5N86_10510 [Planctomycetota bacterium]|nr:hypothetical protein [Planctomycetota bacterium]
MRNYDDLKRNHAHLAEVQYLMCYGRLADARTYEYLVRMKNLRAVVIFSPMPADIDTLAEHCPNIEVLDLNCQYWPCSYNLLRFTALTSLALRGKYWQKMYNKSNRHLVSIIRSLYLPNASPSDLPKLSHSLEVLDLCLKDEQHTLTLASALAENKSLHSLTVRSSIVPNSQDLLCSIPTSIQELTLLGTNALRKSKHSTCTARTLASSFEGLLFSTDLIEQPDFADPVPTTVTSYAKGRLLSVISEEHRTRVRPDNFTTADPMFWANKESFLELVSGKVTQRKMLLIYGNQKGNAVHAPTEVKEILDKAVLQPIVEVLLVEWGHITTEDTRRICELFPNLKLVRLNELQQVDAAKALIKDLPDDCRLQVHLDEFNSEFSDDELSRMDVVLSCTDSVLACPRSLVHLL